MAKFLIISCEVHNLLGIVPQTLQIIFVSPELSNFHTKNLRIISCEMHSRFDTVRPTLQIISWEEHNLLGIVP